MAANAHRVLKTADDSYLSALTLNKKTEDDLRQVRDTVREALRDGFKDWSTYVHKQELFEYAMDSVETEALKPKFKMQGSFSYRTCNKPEHIPPQQIDLDDGMFLPVSFLNQNGTIQPHITSRGYFKTVEQVLKPVCDKNGWTLVTDKSSCVRVQFSKEAHLDLALYAIPDKDFLELQESLLSEAMDSSARTEYVNSLNKLSLREDLYKRIPTDHIMLAHREQGWKPSDPRKLEDWFRSKLNDHGEQLRSVCRYLKGWRDHQWEETKLSSIALMSAVITTYDENPKAFDNSRDDKALLLVAEKLPNILAGKIENPVVKGQFLDEGWTPEMRKEYIIKANELKQSITHALSSTKPQQTLDNLTTAFGSRIPDDQTLVGLESLPIEVKSAATAAASVLSVGLLKNLGDDPSVREAVQKDGDRRYG